MKYSIMGFKQDKLMELGLDIKDAAILRYFVDFMDSLKMRSEIIDKEIYYWVKYEGIINQYPILKLNNVDSVYRRFKKLVQLSILKHKTVINNGKYSYYTLGEGYEELLYQYKCKDNDEMKKNFNGLNLPESNQHEGGNCEENSSQGNDYKGDFYKENNYQSNNYEDNQCDDLYVASEIDQYEELSNQEEWNSYEEWDSYEEYEKLKAFGDFESFEEAQLVNDIGTESAYNFGRAEEGYMQDNITEVQYERELKPKNLAACGVTFEKFSEIEKRSSLSEAQLIDDSKLMEMLKHKELYELPEKTEDFDFFNVAENIRSLGIDDKDYWTEDFQMYDEELKLDEEASEPKLIADISVLEDFDYEEKIKLLRENFKEQTPKATGDLESLIGKYMSKFNIEIEKAKGVEELEKLEDSKETREAREEKESKQLKELSFADGLLSIRHQEENPTEDGWKVGTNDSFIYNSFNKTNKTNKANISNISNKLNINNETNISDKSNKLNINDKTNISDRVSISCRSNIFNKTNVSNGTSYKNDDNRNYNNSNNKNRNDNSNNDSTIRNNNNDNCNDKRINGNRNESNNKINNKKINHDRNKNNNKISNRDIDQNNMNHNSISIYTNSMFKEKYKHLNKINIDYVSTNMSNYLVGG
ncbi:hypothetical protein [Clostridium sp. C8-1-8]|uniref:hypothetical protein n=1 Tax=Clostridium sp. C8-1-8 TaxID=2698831 RepID=UPI00136D5193|nr:hypothetical protein [Clostridium sp. C8-1-8]